MLRKILKALRSALRAMVKALDGTWRTLFGAGAGDIVIDDDHDFVPEEKTVESAGTTPALEEHDLRTDRRRDAALVRIYSMKAVMTGERPELAPCLPRVVRDWLAGLDSGELRMIADATPDAVFSHLGEGPYIQGVHRVQRLQPVPLEMRTGPAVDDDRPRPVADLRAAFGF
jgi:hypothetical protein